MLYQAIETERRSWAICIHRGSGIQRMVWALGILNKTCFLGINPLKEVTILGGVINTTWSSTTLFVAKVVDFAAMTTQAPSIETGCVRAVGLRNSSLPIGLRRNRAVHARLRGQSWEESIGADGPKGRRPWSQSTAVIFFSGALSAC